MAIEQTRELNRYLQEGVDRGASDVYLIPGEPVSFRVGNAIQRSEGEPLSGSDVEAIAAAALGQERLGEIGTKTGQAMTSWSLPGVGGGRLCVARASGDYTIVARTFPVIPDVSRTAIPAAMLEAATSPNGLVVFAGPVGSGKTTSLLSVVEHINATRACHICTVEDPVWYRITPKKAIVQQREVGVDVPSYLVGIEAAMRQDMDVLVAGEMKFVEEVEAVLTACRSGHLVLTQLHADSPADAIDRLIDVQPEENKPLFRRHLAAALRGVSAQRLLAGAEGRGRVGAYAVLIPDEEMRQAIRAGTDVLKRTRPLPEGCRTMAEDIRRLAEEGKIAEQTAREALAEAEAEDR